MYRMIQNCFRVTLYTVLPPKIEMLHIQLFLSDSTGFRIAQVCLWTPLNCAGSTVQS